MWIKLDRDYVNLEFAERLAFPDRGQSVLHMTSGAHWLLGPTERDRVLDALDRLANAQAPRHPAQTPREPVRVVPSPKEGGTA